MASLYFIWVIYARKHPVVKVSQRNLLAMIAIGGIVSSLAIVPTTYDDEGKVVFMVVWG